MPNKVIPTMKSNVCVYLEVFNEEDRIEACIRSFAWADQIFVFDKNSTDNTREIASKYATEVVVVPYCDGSSNTINNIASKGDSEWCLFPTASSIMAPKLVNEIIKLTTDPNFAYDVIGMPFAQYSFGITSKRSPFYAKFKHTLIRRSNLKVSNILHQEIGYKKANIYNIPLAGEAFSLFHCTHRDSESYILHILRYAKYEATQDKFETKRTAFLKILKSVLVVTFVKRSFLLGWNGIALSVAYVLYYCVRFLIIWDRDRELKSGANVYKKIRDGLLDSLNGMN